MLRKTRFAAVAACFAFGSIPAACGGGSNPTNTRGSTGGKGPVDCVNTLDCPEPQVCASELGQCVACVVDAECGPDQRCIGHGCRYPCLTDNDCRPDRQLCDLSISYCVDCLSDLDCPADKFCVQGRCNDTPGAAGGAGGAGAGGTPSSGGSPGQGGSPVSGGTQSDTGGAAEGGVPGAGGTSDGGTDMGGAPAEGGTSTGGTDTGSGGIDTGGTGSSEGGSDTGGVPAEGGSDTGGAPAEGGTSTGGRPTGSNICGDAVLDPGEDCDDGNHDLGDGCTPLCTKEPDCSGTSCVTICGDGLVVASAGEQCDDGNTSDGDGCSSTCQREAGYNCTESGGNTVSLPLVLRDFDANAKDFEPGITNQNDAIPGIVQRTLVDNKPEFSGTNTQQSDLAEFGTLFPDWYRDSARNKAVASTLILYSNGQGGYVNRWGINGEQWTLTTYSNIRWCAGNALHDGCAACNPRPGAGETCYDNGCVPWNNQNECVATVQTTRDDGNPVFFPLDGLGLAPGCRGTDSSAGNYTAPCSTANIAPVYGANWSAEPGGAYHNFSFTSEVRFWFYYDSGRSYQLDFQGDDDVWVFVNRQLAIDLGGIHVPVSGGVRLPDDAAKFGLESGKVYEIAVFQAERQTTGSSYKLSLTGFNLGRSVCTR